MKPCTCEVSILLKWCLHLCSCLCYFLLTVHYNWVSNHVLYQQHAGIQALPVSPCWPELLHGTQKEDLSCIPICRAVTGCMMLWSWHRLYSTLDNYILACPIMEILVQIYQCKILLWQLLYCGCMDMNFIYTRCSTTHFSFVPCLDMSWCPVTSNMYISWINNVIIMALTCDPLTIILLVTTT